MVPSLAATDSYGQDLRFGPAAPVEANLVADVVAAAMRRAAAARAASHRGSSTTI
jgi:hypothetical protein